MARRSKKHEEHENHERWLVSYADFITLLFAFFVVLYATSNADVEKQKEFEDSVRVNLKLTAGGGSSGDNSSAVKNPAEEAVVALVADGKFPQKGGAGETADYVERALDKSMDGDEKKKAIQEIHHDAIGVRIALAAATFFPGGSAKLKLSSLKTLDQVASILKQTNRRVIIEGHTDNQPVVENSQFQSNWELASQRATAVVRYLIKYHQMDPKRFAAISYADQKPVVPNDTPENQAKNRRIEILIVTDEKAAEF